MPGYNSSYKKYMKHKAREEKAVAQQQSEESIPDLLYDFSE